MAQITDEEIIALYQSGQEEAFKELIDRYGAPLYNFAARLAGKTNAPDIVQDIFIKVWKKIGSFDPTKASFKTWVFTIAKNTVNDFFRKKSSLVFSDFGDKGESMDTFAENIPDQELLPTEALAKIEDKEYLNKLLEELPPSHREVLVLHYQEDMTFEEIGKILGKPLNTVKSQHRRALHKLKAIME